MSVVPTSDEYLAKPSPEDEIAYFETVYGETLFDDFYAWCAEFNERTQFHPIFSPYSEATYDLSALCRVTAYPTYANMRFAVSGCNYTSLGRYSFTYNNLYIDIAETVRYLRDFKGENIENLTLVLSDSVLVYVFDAEGHLMQATYSKQIPLQGVSYVHLVGEGYMGCLDIVGYCSESELTEEIVTLFTGTTKGNQIHCYRSNITKAPWYFQLCFRDEVTVVLKLSTPCNVDIVDVNWNRVECGTVTEVVLDGTFYFGAYNRSGESFDYEIIAIPVNQ
jgi:hypothetical protein